ncbi:XRE family transcriptional regulator [Edaphosphingomonas haloaromaticamans]|uniref:XRE family transcriptional regulator n=1 Tax=Edaphosphingomonas haloaromaticamans TaxID=653954 RepID=UPI0008A87E9D|nr:XRE family transcriptional regulator [Sphingomonas haloaromaticamans]
MPGAALITNERQEREVCALIDQIGEALSSDQVLQQIVDGLPPEILDAIRRSLVAERQGLIESLEAYRTAQGGDVTGLKARAGNDLGALLVAARVAKGWKQKELARRLFLPEQQVQRYEAERYRSISLSGLQRVARTLGIKLTAHIDQPLQEPWLPSYEMSSSELQKVLKHARENGWLDKADQSDDNGISQLRRTVAEHVGEYGTPSLLRTGLNVHDLSKDWFLLAWKAQVTRSALRLIQRKKPKYRPLNMSWLSELVKLSVFDDGPVRAKEMLAEQGILLVIEPQIAGMRVDGAAFLIDEHPVIGLTLRLDTLDNFWFTLMHEMGHVILHYRTGLASGFFDDFEHLEIDEMEEEANRFAQNMLIPDAVWSKSPARIAKTAEPIERLAKQLGIAPAIIFGRLRMERQNYKIFSDKIGRGRVRKQLLSKTIEVNDEPVI